ncbi:MAG: thiamine diphosphokinase [Acidimicrobiales bacterium]|nr:thiamine diphosphokinase [Acidimicrobiales bacterium]
MTTPKPPVSELDASVQRLPGGTVAVVIAGGVSPTRNQVDWAIGRADSACVIAADSGADHARELGLTVDVAVGDFDSVSDATQAWLHTSGTRLDAHPETKDFSDLELALELAAETAPDRIVALGLSGGRADHEFINLTVLASDRWANKNVLGISDDTLVTVVRSKYVAIGEPGAVLSVVAVAGPARLTTDGLVFGLEDEEISPTSSRGLSNAFKGSHATITVSEGTALVFQPAAGAYLWDAQP